MTSHAAVVIDEIPRLPRSFYDEAITLPTGWWTRPAAFLQLSPAYDEERKAAEGTVGPSPTSTGSTWNSSLGQPRSPITWPPRMENAGSVCGMIRNRGAEDTWGARGGAAVFGTREGPVHDWSGFGREGDAVRALGSVGVIRFGGSAGSGSGWCVGEAGAVGEGDGEGAVGGEVELPVVVVDVVVVAAADGDQVDRALLICPPSRNPPQSPSTPAFPRTKTAPHWGCIAGERLEPHELVRAAYAAGERADALVCRGRRRPDGAADTRLPRPRPRDRPAPAARDRRAARARDHQPLTAHGRGRQNGRPGG